MIPVLAVMLFAAVPTIWSADEESPWAADEDRGPWTAERVFPDGAFEGEPKDRVRLVLDKSEDMQAWESTPILEEWLDDGTIIQEDAADRMFYRLVIVPMDRTLVEGALTMDVEGDHIVGRLDVRTRAWQMIQHFVRDFHQVPVPVPWEKDPRVQPEEIDAAHAAVTEILGVMLERLESGAFRAADTYELRRRFRGEAADETENTEEGVEE